MGSDNRTVTTNSSVVFRPCPKCGHTDVTVHIEFWGGTCHKCGWGTKQQPVAAEWDVTGPDARNVDAIVWNHYVQKEQIDHE